MKNVKVQNLLESYGNGLVGGFLLVEVMGPMDY